MSHSKADQFGISLFHQSFWSRALSHPARIIILQHLLEYGRSPFKDFRKKIQLSQPTISQHIRYLLSMGIIILESKFPYATYSINAEICHSLVKEIQKTNRRFLRPPQEEL